MANKYGIYSIRLSPEESAELDELAKLTGRSRGSVLRILLKVVKNNPDLILAFLGVVYE